VDEAMSIYRRSAGMVSLEMHSPIMCIAQGIPAIVCRWDEQSSKGFMWRDIGLDDWLFDFDLEEDIHRMPAAALRLAQDPAAAKARAAKAKAFVDQCFTDSMNVLKNTLGA
jgi:polysaccharide pyruvyl transferase WcaK-like protein